MVPELPAETSCERGEKPSPLTSAEWRTVVQHPRIGQVILEQATALRDAVPIILHHHERYSGHGYPYGLRGNDIPLGARIVAIAEGDDGATAATFVVTRSTVHAGRSDNQFPAVEFATTQPDGPVTLRAVGDHVTAHGDPQSAGGFSVEASGTGGSVRPVR